MTKTFQRKSLATAIAFAVLVLSACSSSSDAGPSSIALGSAATYGSTDDGRFFYRTTIDVHRGTVVVESANWTGSESPAAINISPGGFIEGDGGGAVYQAGDNTDSLPLTLSADGEPSAVVTLIFEQEEEPAGSLAISTKSGGSEKTLEVVPTWDE